MLPVRRGRSRELGTVRDMFDSFFDDALSRMGAMDMLHSAGSGNVPLDIYEEGDNIIVKASLPGIRAEDVNVEVQDDMVRISGEMKQEQERKEENYFLREHRVGRVDRTASLPYPVDAGKASADFEDGVLTLTLPKTSESRRHQIPVNRR